MTLALEWTGQEAFAAEPLREWEVDGAVAGLTRSAGPFTFVTLDGDIKKLLTACFMRTQELIATL